MRDTLLTARDFLAARNIEPGPGGRHRAPTRAGVWARLRRWLR